MEIVQGSLECFGYTCVMKAPGEPELYPQEEVYIKV